MKKTVAILSFLLLAGVVSVNAQSDGAGKGQEGAGPVNNARKAKSGLTEGKGLPYSKEGKKRPNSNKPIPPSKVGTESDVTARAAGKISPGSHNQQRDRKAGVNATKPTSQSTN
ncbi:hypothetical protein GCM10027592_16220 [Spirosoma flavus]